MKVKFNKLVRDNIPDIIQKEGDEVTTHIAEGEEFYIKLKEKLLEEVAEFVGDETIEEFADMVEVMYAICDEKGWDKKDIEKIRKEKAQKRGSFSKKIILEETRSGE